MLSVAVVKREPSTPVYNIGVTSRLCGLPIHTLRWIEQHGLISPFRTDGNQRLFSELDLGLIRKIRDLMEQEVNLPGIRIILRMKSAAAAASPRAGGRRRGSKRPASSA